MEKLSAVVRTLAITIAIAIAIAACIPAVSAENVAPVSVVTYSYNLLVGQVTGGGWIPSPDDPDKKVHFSFGNRLLFDQATGMKVHRESINTPIISESEEGYQATFTGTARIDGISGYSFIVDVEDKGEPGWKKGDTFTILITDHGGFDYSASGTLGNGKHGGGNIKIHDSPVETLTTDQPIELDASQSYDPGGNIVEYSWDFGDGTPIQEGNIVEITHSYTDKGNYTVTLTVVDDEGATNVTTIAVTVSEGEEGEGISGNVMLEEVSLSVPEDERQTIGELIEITGSATLNNTGDDTNVTVVEICVDGNIIYRENTTLSPEEVKTIDDISVEWLPMSSGTHHISLQVRERVGDEYYWIGPTNDLSAEVKVYIEKVT